MKYRMNRPTGYSRRRGDNPMKTKSSSQVGRGTPSGATAASLMIAALAMGCGQVTILAEEDATCGEGTVLQGGECVADGSTGDSGPGPDCDGDVDADCGSIDAASYTTDPGYFDAVLDTERHQLFLSYGESGVVRVIGLADGSDKVVTTGFKAEHMHFDPSRDQVAITLPSGDHSPTWWEEDQEGYVGAIDAISLADPKPIWIPLDPWQIVADGSGNVHASGASGQWTSAITVNLTSGSATKAGSVYQWMIMELHPALNRVYAADAGLSPSDIERWDITNGTISPSYDSPYHGDYPMCDDLRIHPSGSTIYTKCGHVFLASDVKETDMTWVADMGTAWEDLAFHPSGEAVYVITKDAPAIHEYNAASMMPAATHPLSAPAQRILAGPTYLVVVRGVSGGNPKTQVEVIPYAEL